MMAQDIYPLIPTLSYRDIDARSGNLWTTTDALSVNCMLTVIKDPVRTSIITAYLEKRPGVKSSTTIATSNSTTPQFNGGVEDKYGFTNLDNLYLIRDTGGSDWHTYIGTTHCGRLEILNSLPNISLSKTNANGEENYMVAVGRNGGYFIGETAMKATTSYTVNTSTGQSTFTAVQDFTGLVVGQAINASSQTVISSTAASAQIRITALDAAASTMTLTTTALLDINSTVITRQRIAKIVHPNFPTSTAGQFVELNGRQFIAQYDTQNVYNSSSGSLINWGAADFIPANKTLGKVTGLSPQKEYVIAHKTDGAEYFYHDGANLVGSVLSRQDNLTARFKVSVIGSNQTTSLQGSSHANVDDMVVVIADGVYLLSFGELKKVSVSSIDRLITNVDAGQLVVSMFNRFGRYFIYLENSDLTLSTAWAYLYDIESNFWTKLEFPTTYLPKRISRHLGYWTTPIAASSTIMVWGWIGFEQDAVYTDASSSYTMKVQSNARDQNTGARKDPEYYELVADTYSTGVTNFYVSDDDFQTTTAMSSFNMTKHVKRIERAKGYEGARAIGIEHSTNTPWRGQAIRMKYKVTGR